MSEAQTEQQPNNAAVEIARRKAILDSRANQENVQAAHRANVPVQAAARNPMVHPARMRLAEYDRQEWIVNAEPGHTIEDCLQPSYWSHMAQRMQAYDHIEVRAEDGTWVADFLVVQVDRMWAKVVLRQKFEFDTGALPKETAAHSVEWKGPHRKFAVIRLSDQECVRDGFSNKEDAAQWMREHERVVHTTG